MGQFAHNNVVRLHGVVTVGEPVSTTNIYRCRELTKQCKSGAAPLLKLHFPFEVVFNNHKYALDVYVTFCDSSETSLLSIYTYMCFFLLQVLVVLEYMTRGDLRSFLQKLHPRYFVSIINL